MKVDPVEVAAGVIFVLCLPVFLVFVVIYGIAERLGGES